MKRAVTLSGVLQGCWRRSEWTSSITITADTAGQSFPACAAWDGLPNLLRARMPARALASRYDFVAVDTYCYGRSLVTRSDGEPSEAALNADLRAVLR